MTTRIPRGCNPLALLLAFFVAIAPLSYGQSGSGTIVGQVSNSGTDSTLEGVRVSVTPGDHVVYTRRGGEYRVTGLASGEYRVMANYTGMDASSATVKVTSGSVARQNFGLTSDIYELAPLRIAGEREGSAVAITLQRNADNVITVLDSEAFGSIAKANIGNFLQRVPGLVGVQGEVDSDGVGVRGFQAHLSEVQFDGSLVAHAETASNDRGARVDALQAQLVKRVEVTKAPTPDMSAGSAGGTVNLISKSAFDFAKETNSGFAMSFTKDYTNNESMTPSFNTYYSTIMGKNDNIGVFLLANTDEVVTVRAYTTLDHEDDWDFEGPHATRFDKASYDRHHQIRTGGSAKVDFKLDDDRLSMLHFKLSYTKYEDDMHRTQHKYKTNKNSFSDKHLVSVSDDGLVSTFKAAQYELYRNIRDENTQDWNFQFSGEHEYGEYELDYSYSLGKSAGTENRKRFTARSDNEFGYTVDRTNSIHWPEVTVLGGITPSEDDFSNTERMRIRRILGSWASDEVMNARVSLKRRFNTENPIFLKTGLEVRDQTKNRDDTEDRWEEMDRGGLDFSSFVEPDYDQAPSYGYYPVMSVMDTHALDDALNAGDLASIMDLELDDTIKETYQDDGILSEKVSAAYIMGNMDINRVAITTGVRFEQTDFAGFAPRLNEGYSKTDVRRYAEQAWTSGTYSDFFPSLHLKWEPANDWLLRASVNTSIGRPDMGQIIAREEVDYEAEPNPRVKLSNPDLAPQEVTSYELSAEHYFEPAGLVSVSLFQKDISGLIYNETIDEIGVGPDNGFDGNYEGYELRRKINGGNASVEGIELNYQQQFDFLPSFWKGFGIYANYTYLTTIGDYDNDGEIDGELEDFKPRTGNIGINFERGRFSARLQANYIGRYLDDVKNDPSQTVYYDKRTVIDWNTRYAINERYTVFFDATNIGGEHRSKYQALANRISETQGQSSTLSFGLIGKF